MHYRRQLSILICLIGCVGGGPLFAAELRVAVASNFEQTMRLLAANFEQRTGHKVKLSRGSSGKHFTQIVNGAPFDLFLAADSSRPTLLENQGRIVDDSRFVYAVGSLVLWSNLGVSSDLNNDSRLTEIQSIREILLDQNYPKLAIANPKHAPYGLAAQEVLESLNLLPSVASKLVTAENVAQAFQFVASNSVELGFTSLAQVRYLQKKGTFSGWFWHVPTELYTPIQQQLVVLKDSDAARELADFLKSEAAQSIIRDQGYDTL